MTKISTQAELQINRQAELQMAQLAQMGRFQNLSNQQTTQLNQQVHNLQLELHRLQTRVTMLENQLQPIQQIFHEAFSHVVAGDNETPVDPTLNTQVIDPHADEILELTAKEIVHE